jgi:hypothetical protein
MTAFQREKLRMKREENNNHKIEVMSSNVT